MVDYKTDLEKQPVQSTDEVHHGKSPSGVDTGGAISGETFGYGASIYATLQRFAGSLNIEQRGIERVPEDERTDSSLLNVGTMWLSANMVISSFALGMLGKTVFFLGFVDGVLVIILFNILGILPVCYCSTLGQTFGLRQMVLSRFWFGFHGVKVAAVFNVLACVGWSAINAIVGAQLLHAVNNNVPGYAGIIIIASCTFIVTLFGYKAVHLYEFWSWLPISIIFLITLGVFARSGDFRNVPMGTGESEMGSVLSFGCVIFGFAAAWTTVAADYTVYQPVNQSRIKIFFSTGAGLIISLLFVEILGLAIVTATSIDGGNNRYQENYDVSATGGLLAAVLFPPLGGFGKFCLVILSLSTVANNCPNMYSIALTLQVFSRWTKAIPRFIWTIFGTIVYVAIAIPGYSHFEAVLHNFMNFIGYWLAIYLGVALSEHLIYKRGLTGYQPEHYDQPNKLPPGIAAIAAFCCGIAGMVIGMSQVWFVGPVALTAGEAPFGGDVGFELAMLFAFASYAIFRLIELKKFGR